MTPGTLKYSDSTDRAYGLCGMAFAMFVYDVESCLDTLSVDSEVGDGLTVTPDFFAASNPNLSVKSVWSTALKQFQLTSAMAIANLLARSMARRNADIPPAIRADLYRDLAAEGAETCGLEASEANALCDRSFSYLRDLLQQRPVAFTLKQMADSLESEGSLTHDKILAFLQPLSRY